MAVCLLEKIVIARVALSVASVDELDIWYRKCLLNDFTPFALLFLWRGKWPERGHVFRYDWEGLAWIYLYDLGLDQGLLLFVLSFGFATFRRWQGWRLLGSFATQILSDFIVFVFFLLNGLDRRHFWHQMLFYSKVSSEKDVLLHHTSTNSATAHRNSFFLWYATGDFNFVGLHRAGGQPESVGLCHWGRDLDVAFSRVNSQLLLRILRMQQRLFWRFWASALLTLTQPLPKQLQMGQLTGNLAIKQHLFVSFRVKWLRIGETVEILHVVIVCYL